MLTAADECHKPSGNCQGILHCLESGHPVYMIHLKTIADICFLLGSYTDWRKISDNFACQGHFSEGSRSLDLGKVMSYSGAGSEIPSQMSSLSSDNMCYAADFGLLNDDILCCGCSDGENFTRRFL